uniref:TIR domain-containing protein n=1 Tax=Eptatretus burgeri TaxID=7764 RepID=A0A8C4QY81_EPTBU
MLQLSLFFSPSRMQVPLVSKIINCLISFASQTEIIVESFLPRRSGPAMLNIAIILTIFCTYLSWASNTACLTSCTHDTKQRECSTRWDSSDRLDLSSCGLHSVCQALFVDHEHISILDLSENHLCCFEASSFSNLHALQILKLHGQVLDNTVHRPTVNFSDLQHLKELSIMSYHVGNLSDLSHLRDFGSRLNLLELFFNPQISSNMSLNITGNLFVKQLRLSGKVKLWKDLQSLLLSVKDDPSIEIIINVDYLDFTHCNCAVYLTKLRLVQLTHQRLNIWQFFGDLIALRSLKESHNSIQGRGRCYYIEGMFETLEELDISNNPLKELKPCFPQHLKKFDLSYTQLSNIPDWFPGHFANLSVLGLEGNRLTTVQLHNMSLRELDVSRNLISSLDPFSLPQGLGLVQLNLSHNSITTLGTQVFPISMSNINLSSNTLSSLNPNTLPPNVHFLDLSQNKLYYISAGALPPSLIFLNISWNKLKGLEKDSLEGLLALKLFDAQHNPFFCTCDLRWFIEDFSQRSELNISHVENYLCTSRSTWEGKRKPILTYTVDDIKCSLGIQAAIGLASITVVLIILITVFIKCHGPWYMRMGWYWIRLKGKSHLDPETDFLYDAFVSYSEKDAAWSYDLIQKLEAEGLRVCCHERDFMAGRPIIDNIMESIEGSRRAVFLLSENFVASAWCHYEFYFAQQRLMQSAEDRLILVLLDKLQHDSIPRRFVRLKQLLGRKCLLEFPKEPEKQDTFWNDLRAALQQPLNEPDAGKH